MHSRCPAEVESNLLLVVFFFFALISTVNDF